MGIRFWLNLRDWRIGFFWRQRAYGAGVITDEWIVMPLPCVMVVFQKSYADPDCEWDPASPDAERSDDE